MKPDSLYTKIRQSLTEVFRFGLVGVLATTIHLMMLFIILKTTLLPVLLANLVAFLVAFSASFLGNYHWTFSKPGNQRRAVSRFFLISGSAFLINTLVLSLILKANKIAPLHAALLSALIIPAVTFLASKLWAFRFD